MNSPGYASKTFPATWSQISISFISDFIKNWSCFSDKEREAQFVHSWNVCLSFNTHVGSISSQLGNRKSAHILWNSPMALLECRLNQPFIYQQQSVFWRQPEFVTSRQLWALRVFESSSQPLFLDRPEVERHCLWSGDSGQPPTLCVTYRQGDKSTGQIHQTVNRSFRLCNVGAWD